MSNDDDSPLPFYPLRIILSIACVLVGLFVFPTYLGKWITQPLLWIPIVIFGIPLFPTFTGIILGNTKASLNNLVASYFCETYELIFQLVFILIILVPIAFMLSSVITAIAFIVTTIVLIIWGLAWIGLPIGVSIPDDWWLGVATWIGATVIGAIQFTIITFAQNYTEAFYNLCRAIHSKGLVWIQRVCGARL